MATYDNIIGATGDVAQMLENDSAELVAFLPRAVEIAEQRVYNELPATAFNTGTVGTVSAGVIVISRPADITTLRHLMFQNGSSQWVPLEFMDYQAMREIYPSESTQGFPSTYSVNESDSFSFAPAANGTLSWRLGYRKPLTALATGSPANTNWLTQNAYSLLLTATVVECVRFVIDDRQAGLMQFYESKYAELLTYFSNRETRNLRDDFRARPVKQSNDKDQKE